MGFWKKAKDNQSVEGRAREQVRNEDVAELLRRLERYNSELRVLDDDLERCKHYIEDLEKAIDKTTREYESLTGGRKKIVGGKLRSLLEQRERALGEPSVIQKKIDSLNVLVATTRATLAGMRGVKIADDAETIAVEQDAVKDELEREKDAVRFLDRTRLGRSSVDELDLKEDAELESLLNAYREETAGGQEKARRESATQEKRADFELDENLAE